MDRKAGRHYLDRELAWDRKAESSERELEGAWQCLVEHERDYVTQDLSPNSLAKSRIQIDGV